MKVSSGLLIAVLLGAGAGQAQDTRDRDVSISLGGGLAYDLVDLNLAYRAGHVEGFLGLGLLTLLPGASIGARYFVRPDGTGFFMALNAAGHRGVFLDDQATSGSLFWATVTPGYRLAIESSFLQVAIGGGVAYLFKTFDTPPSPTKRLVPILDAMLALGFRF